MLSVICWTWLFIVLGGFFLVPVLDNEMDNRNLAGLVFGSALIAAVYLVSR